LQNIYSKVHFVYKNISSSKIFFVTEK